MKMARLRKFGIALIVGGMLLAGAGPVLAQVSDPVISGVDVSIIPNGIRLLIKGSGFTSYNNVTVQNGSTAKTVPAASATGAAAAANLTNLSPGTYQITLSTSRGQTSNGITATVVEVQASSPPPVPVPSSSPAVPLPSTPFILPTPTFAQDIVLPSARPTDPNNLPSPVACILFGARCGFDKVYTAVGDSLGTGFISFGGFVHRYEENIEDDNGIKVDLKNRSRVGATTETIKVSIQHDPRTREALAAADYITINGGGNDLREAREKFLQGQCGGSNNQQCLREATDRLKQNWSEIIQGVTALKKGSNVKIRGLDIYYPYVDEDRASGNFAIFHPYIQEVNGHIAAALAANSIPLAPVYAAFNGASGDIDPAGRGLISFDGFHPNTAGHRVIAGLLRAIGY